MCRCCARPSETERHLHTELPQRLAYSSPVGEGNSRAQIRNTPAFGEFRVQNQPAKELVHPYTADCVLRHETRLYTDASVTNTGTHDQTRSVIVQSGHMYPPQTILENAYGSSIPTHTIGNAVHENASILV